MRLLDTFTGQLELFTSLEGVRYATLSHVWATECQKDSVAEFTHDNFARIRLSSDPSPSSNVILPRLSHKIQQACSVARSHGYPYIWIDT